MQIMKSIQDFIIQSKCQITITTNAELIIQQIL